MIDRIAFILGPSGPAVAVGASNPTVFHPVAQNLMGRALLCSGRSEDAVAFFRRAASAKPEKRIYGHNLALALLSAGRHEEAIAVCEAVLGQHPASASTLALLGDVLERSGRYAAARQAYRRSVRLAPGLVWPKHALAWMLATCPDATVRNGEAAVELALSVCRLTANASVRAWDALAAAYAECGRFEEAVAAAEMAVALADERVYDVVLPSHVGQEEESSDGAATGSDLREALRGRLDMYRNRIPFREGAR
jgi:tetratricopeptide (TPR) repeat protein